MFRKQAAGMKLKLWIGLAVVAALGVVLAFQAWPVARSKRGAGREPVSVAGVVDAPRRTCDGSAEAIRVRQELTEVKAQLSELQETVAAKQAPEEPPDEYAQMTRQERRDYHDQKWREHMAEVAAAFELEPRDPSWSATAKQALESALAREPVLQQVAGKIDCRSSTCRLEVSRDADGKVDKQLLPMLNTLAETLPEMEAKETTIDGKSTYTLYLKDSRRRQAEPSKMQ
jgi:hypothetical protein